jgi:hypothetical protein
MERRNLHLGFTREEAHRAFDKGYNNKAVKVRWKYLCELLNWEYRPNKRNGRSREEHLEFLRDLKVLRRQKVLPRIKELTSKGISIRRISTMIGVSEKAIRMWLKQSH